MHTIMFDVVVVAHGLFCFCLAVDAYLPNEFTDENICLFAYVEYK